MRLFQMEVHRGRDGRVLIAHFPSEDEALAHIKEEFSGWEIRSLVEITQRAHFHIADLDLSEAPRGSRKR
jgi:broad specificity phosphatase PhoE